MKQAENIWVCQKCGEELRITNVPNFIMICDNCGGYSDNLSHIIEKLRGENMNCVNCGNTLQELVKARKCKNKECELYDIEITKAVYEYPHRTLNKREATNQLQETLNYILNFRLQPEHIILLAFSTAFALMMFWVGVLLTI